MRRYNVFVSPFNFFFFFQNTWQLNFAFYKIWQEYKNNYKKQPVDNVDNSVDSLKQWLTEDEFYTGT